MGLYSKLPDDIKEVDVIVAGGKESINISQGLVSNFIV
jgi:hypothetical protein